MRKLLIVFLAFSCMGLYAQNTYFVATNGNDLTGDGSEGKPWASWQKGSDMAKPGDTVYIKGGVYYPLKRISSGISGAWVIDTDTDHGTSGQPGKWIYFFADPDDYKNGNFPILDLSKMDNGTSNFVQGLRIHKAQFLHFKGLTIRNVWQNKNASAPEAWGVATARSANMIFENMTVHNIAGRGWWIQGGAWNPADSAYAVDVDDTKPIDAKIYCAYDTTQWINCDTYDLCDSIDYTGAGDPGNSADGWKCTFYGGNYIRWYGCRAWNFTDDGWDPSITVDSETSDGPEIFIENCWSMPSNKYLKYCTDNAADGKEGIEGNGFKFGAAGRAVPNDPAGYFINCLAMYTANTGFASNIEIIHGNYDIKPRHINNTAFRAGVSGFAVENINNGERECVFYNNLVYESKGLDPGTKKPYEVAIAGPPYEESHNAWDYKESYPYFVMTDSIDIDENDFVTTDSLALVTLFTAPRNSDGSLPPFPVQLAPGSDLIDSGTDVGYSFAGSAPDIGAFEYGALSVRIEKPVDKTRYNCGNELVLSATARDPDNSIESVSFYKKKGELIGEGSYNASSHLWELDWECDTIGTIEIRAVAVNDEDETAYSQIVSILVYPQGVNLNEENPCQLQYFPNNPNAFRIILPEQADTDLNIISLEGRVVGVEKMYLNEAPFKDINLSYLSAGMYIIQITNPSLAEKCLEPLKFIKFE